MHPERGAGTDEREVLLFVICPIIVMALLIAIPGLSLRIPTLVGLLPEEATSLRNR